MKPIEAKQSTRGNPEKADPKTQYDLELRLSTFLGLNPEFSVTFENANVELFVGDFARKDFRKFTKQPRKTILPVVLGHIARRSFSFCPVSLRRLAARARAAADGLR